MYSSQQKPLLVFEPFIHWGKDRGTGEGGLNKPHPHESFTIHYYNHTFTI